MCSRLSADSCNKIHTTLGIDSFWGFPLSRGMLPLKTENMLGSNPRMVRFLLCELGVVSGRCATPAWKSPLRIVLDFGSKMHGTPNGRG